MIEIDDNLIQRYENLLFKSQKYLIPEKEANIFDTAYGNYYENPTTELLAFFLNPHEKHNLQDSFYKGFVEALRQKDEFEDFDFGDFVEISTQQKTDKGGIIDLWIQTDRALIIVEVKIYHHQNNPFKQYTAWGRKKTRLIQKQNKEQGISDEDIKLVQVVLCPDGRCQVDDWQGLSFTELTDSVKSSIARYTLENPINKWIVFAREFILHLKGFNELLETNMDSIKFVIDNMNQIQNLVDLQKQVYEEIIEHINVALKNDIGEDYEPYNQRHTWSGTPALRFANNNWESHSDSVLNLHVYNMPMSCAVNMYIENPTDEILTKVKKILSKGGFGSYDDWFESNKRYWGASWNFSSFDLEKVTQIIIRNQNLLHLIETEMR